MQKEDTASGYPSGIPRILLPIPELLSMDALLKFFNFFNNLIKTYKKYVQDSHGFSCMTSGIFSYDYIFIICCFKHLNHGITVTLGTLRVILQGNYRANMYFILCMTSGMFTYDYICIICCF